MMAFMLVGAVSQGFPHSLNISEKLFLKYRGGSVDIGPDGANFQGINGNGSQYIRNRSESLIQFARNIVAIATTLSCSTPNSYRLYAGPGGDLFSKDEMPYVK